MNYRYSALHQSILLKAVAWKDGAVATASLVFGITDTEGETSITISETMPTVVSGTLTLGALGLVDGTIYDLYVQLEGAAGASYGDGNSAYTEQLHLSIELSPVGNVFGSETSVDHSVVRFDGTDNKTIQDSLALIDDAGILTAPTLKSNPQLLRKCVLISVTPIVDQFVFPGS